MPGILQYYITNDVPLSDIYGDFMNWFDLYGPEYSVDLPSNTQIFRLNITIPIPSNTGTITADASVISTTAATSAAVAAVAAVGAAAYCATRFSDRRDHTEWAHLDDEGP
jgi:hypothetical protein